MSDNEISDFRARLDRIDAQLAELKKLLGELELRLDALTTMTGRDAFGLQIEIVGIKKRLSHIEKRLDIASPEPQPAS